MRRLWTERWRVTHCLMGSVQEMAVRDRIAMLQLCPFDETWTCWRIGASSAARKERLKYIVVQLAVGTNDARAGGWRA